MIKRRKHDDIKRPATVIIVPSDNGNVAQQIAKMRNFKPLTTIAEEIDLAALERLALNDTDLSTSQPR